MLVLPSSYSCHPLLLFMVAYDRASRSFSLAMTEPNELAMSRQHSFTYRGIRTAARTPLPPSSSSSSYPISPTALSSIWPPSPTSTSLNPSTTPSPMTPVAPVHHSHPQQQQRQDICTDFAIYALCPTCDKVTSKRVIYQCPCILAVAAGGREYGCQCRAGTGAGHEVQRVCVASESCGFCRWRHWVDARRALVGVNFWLERWNTREAARREDILERRGGIGVRKSASRASVYTIS
ncbi:hypothetical protein GGS23DRAFT_591381 [Durotheca rogersii]|uniref:uncharacterized protein n=1 Tax=Durotheca rogersii TaxID=419775 RepID=UPI00221E647D|nr:uncharacterized protein GGS23DRAFT_591381 [Durotheca rogersii]KAI5852045.1 hypothetical protein GGS23DRAFT_591381 [Durotheca rogersii]